VSVVSSSIAGGTSDIGKLIGSTYGVANVTMTLADTEYSYALPAGTKYWKIQNRDAGLIKLAFASGTSGTTWFSVWPGNQEDGYIKNSTASVTLYFQSPKAAQTLEIYTLS